MTVGVKGGPSGLSVVTWPLVTVYALNWPGGPAGMTTHALRSYTLRVMSSGRRLMSVNWNCTGCYSAKVSK